MPSPLKSPTAKYQGFAPTAEMSAGRKVPSPLPKNTETVLSPTLETARSGLPSPLKSPTAMPEGPFLVAATYSVWGLNNGVCAHVGCGNGNRKNKVAATSSDDLPNFLFMEHQAVEFGASSYRATKATRESITRSALRTEQIGR